MKRNEMFKIGEQVIVTDQKLHAVGEINKLPLPKHPELYSVFCENWDVDGGSRWIHKNNIQRRNEQDERTD
jgi:hypothetical protein